MRWRTRRVDFSGAISGVWTCTISSVYKRANLHVTPTLCAGMPTLIILLLYILKQKEIYLTKVFLLRERLCPHHEYAPQIDNDDVGNTCILHIVNLRVALEEV